jgi:superfamily II DNA or RNA helicase
MPLNEQEKLLLLQLQAREYWSEKSASKKKDLDPNTPVQPPEALPEKWCLLQNIILHQWQREAIEKWWVNKNGIAKVVTGGGKKIF